MANIRAFPTGIPCLPIERICEYNELRSFVPCRENEEIIFLKNGRVYFKKEDDSLILSLDEKEEEKILLQTDLLSQHLYIFE